MARDDDTARSAEALLQRLDASGIRVFLRDSQVHVQAAPGVLSCELKGELQARRDDIADHLRKIADPIASLPAVPERKAPLMPWQRGFWLLHLRPDADLAVLHSACLLIIRGPLDTGRLERALAVLCAEQEILRARFLASGDGGAEQLDSGQGPGLKRISLEEMREGEGLDAFARRKLAELLARRFDLEREAPLRFQLMSEGDEEHRLLIAAHHVAVDGWSLGLLLSSLFRHYDAGGCRVESGSPGSFFDAAHYFDGLWRRPEALREIAEAGADLARLPLCQALPTDFRRGALSDASQGAVHFEFSPEMKSQLLALAEERSGGLYAALMACLNLLYSSLTGRDRLVAMSPVANRCLSPALEGMAGCLANGILVAPRVSASSSLRDALSAVVAQSMPRLENQGLPFDDILDAAAPPRLPATYPAAQIFLALQDAATLPRSKTLSIELAELPALGRQDLLIEFRHNDGGGLDGRVNYDARLFSRETAEAFTEALVALAEAAVAAPDLAAASLPLSKAAVPTEAAVAVACADPSGRARLSERERHLAGRLAAIARPGETVVWAGPLGLERLAVLRASEAAGLRLLALPPDVAQVDAALLVEEAEATVFVSAGDLQRAQGTPDELALPAYARKLRRVGRDSAPLPSDPEPERLVLGHGGLIVLSPEEVRRRREAAARAVALLDIAPRRRVTLDLAVASDEVIDLLEQLAGQGCELLQLASGFQPVELLLSTHGPGEREVDRCILVNHFSAQGPCLLGTPEGGLLACCQGFQASAAFQEVTALRPELRVLTPQGLALPAELPGELSLPLPEGAGRAGIARGPVAKLRAGGTLALLSDPLAAGSGWVKGRYLDFAACAAALTQGAALADAALSLRQGSEGAELIAWVSPAGSGGYEALCQAVRQALAGRARPDHIVRLNVLPRDVDGRLDRHRLSLLPVVATTTLDSAPERRDLQVEVLSPEASPQSRHLSAMLPPEGQSGIRALPTFGLSEGWRREGDQTRGAVPALARGPAFDALYPEGGWNPLRWLNDETGADRILRTLEFDGAETRTAFRDLSARARRIASGLRQAGYGPGNVIVLAPRRCLDIVAGFFGAMAAGVTVAPVPHPRDWAPGDASFDRLVHISHLTEADALLAGEPVSLTAAPALDLEVLSLDGLEAEPEVEAVHAWQAEETLLISFTSGSTGAPKGVLLCAENAWTQTSVLGPALGIGPGDVALNFTGLDHVASLIGFCGSALNRGAQLAIFSVERFLADPETLIDRLSDWKVAQTWAPDFAWSLLADRLEAREPGSLDLSTLRAVCSGGECPLDATCAKLKSEFARQGAAETRLVTSWGMAETTSFFTLSAPWDGKGAHHVENGVIDSGAALPGTELRVVGAAGSVLSEGQVGHLEVRGGQVFSRYIVLREDGAKTRAKTQVGPLTADGWLKTGDLALISKGRAFLLGREKDVLILNGQNVAQAAIEDEINGLEGVEPNFTAVVATRDARSGESLLVVFFCPAYAQESSRDLTKLARGISGAVAARYGVSPDYLLPVAKSDVPKTGLGKIQRTRLRKAFEAGAFQQTVRRMDLLLKTERSLPSVFQAWCDLPLDIALPARLARPCVLLLDDGLGAARALERALMHLDVRTLCLPASALDGDAAAAFLRQGAIVVDFPTACDRDDELVGEMLRRVRLASRLYNGKDRPLRLLWIERNDRGWNMGRAAAAALRHESRGAVFQSLKPRTLISDADAEALARAVLGAVGAHDHSLELDGENRLWTSRLAPLAEPAPQAWAAVPQEATLVVAGGLGAVGRVLLPQLLAWTDWRFLVLGRRTSEAASRALQGWALDPKQAARIDYRQADAEDPGAIARCCADLAVDGVVNMTSRAERSPLAQVSEAQLQDLVAKRVGIVGAFDEAFKGREIPVVHVTSVYADLGGHDFFAYCLANAAQKHWIAERTGRRPKHVDLTCGFWMPAGGPSDVTDYQSRLGYTAIDGRSGAAGVIRALLGPDRRLVIGLNAEGTETRPLALSRPEPFDRIVVRPRGRELGKDVVEALRARAEGYGLALLFEDRAGRSAEASLDERERKVLGLWREVLGPDAEILPDSNFFDSGGTSLLAARLHLRLQETFGGPKDLVALFSHTTVRAQARLLAAPEEGAAPEPAAAPRSKAKSKQRKGRDMARRRRAARTTQVQKGVMP